MAALEGDRLPPDILQAVQEGKLWRAKEILSGRIGTAGFDPRLYEQYGTVLVKMGDLVEAGKYLFISGARQPEFAEALNLFRDRHARGGWQSMLGTWPSRAKSIPIESLPASTQEDLRSLGLPPGFSRKSVAEAAKPSRSKVKDKLISAGCIAALLFVLASFLVGAPVVVKAVLAWFR